MFSMRAGVSIVPVEDGYGYTVLKVRATCPASPDRRRERMVHRRGFTLIELLVVIAIM